MNVVRAREDVSEAVRTAIKREGKFDSIRKKALENLKVGGYLEELQTEVKCDIEELLRTLPDNWTKEQIRIRIREHIQGGGYLPKIRNKIEMEMANNWVNDELGEDIEKKVRSSYGLSENDECEVVNEGGESPILDVIG